MSLIKISLSCFILLTSSYLSASKNPLVSLSQRFVESLRSGDLPHDIVEEYASIKQNELMSILDSKNKKLAFWINTYNAFVIYKLRQDTTQFEDKGAFYKIRNIDVGGIKMSFDDIEHGIIRNNRCKYSYGFFGNPFSESWIDRYKNKEVDGRVHFALNCGAKSCPPVAIMDDQKLDDQLDRLTKNYLDNYSTVEGNRVFTSALFGWFRGDFGDISGIKEYLVRFGIIDDVKRHRVIFGEYDWSLHIGNYAEI